MKYISILLLTLLMGCATESDDSDGDTDTEQSAVGIWQGTVTSSSGAVNGIIASNGKAFFYTESQVLMFGTVSVSVNDFNYNGTAYASGFTPYNLTMSGSVVTDNSIDVNFTTPQETGTFHFDKADADFGVYDRSSELTKLEGIWNDDTSDSVGSWVFEIDDDGSFTALRAADNCSMDGQFNNIDEDKNEFSVAVSITSCGVSNGNYSGLAFTSDADTFTDNVINLMFENGQIAAQFKAVKQ